MATEEGTMNQEPFIVERYEAEWVAKALATEKTRPVITYAAIGYYKGSAVLVATDTFRLHVLRLGPVEAEFATKVIDIRRVILEAKQAKAKRIAIATDLSEVMLAKVDGKTTLPFEAICVPVFPEVGGEYPHFQRVIPETKRPVAEFFVVNSKFFADAIAMADKNNCKLFLYSENATRKPLVFSTTSDRWFAIVVPICDENWVERFERQNREQEKGV